MMASYRSEIDPSGHRKINGGPRKLYSVWNARTDELIILDGSSARCAEALGLRDRHSFDELASRTRHGKDSRYHIEQKKRGDVDE